MTERVPDVVLRVCGRVRDRFYAVRWKRLGVSVLSLAVTGGILSASWMLAGPVDTIVYTVLFLVGAVGVPATVALFGPSFPRSMSKVFGSINFILAQLAFGHGYLVEFDDKYEMCPGTSDQVYVKGEWRDLNGTENKTVLGWQPFGLIRYKEEGTMEDVRADAAATRGTRADGGAATERAGFPELPPDASVSGLDGNWLIDLKRVYTRGLRKVGDIMMIEKAEEVAMREEAKEGTFDGMEPIIGGVVGLILGIITGYVMVGGA